MVDISVISEMSNTFFRNERPYDSMFFHNHRLKKNVRITLTRKRSSLQDLTIAMKKVGFLFCK
jgi:hypothetical protein